MVSAITLNEQSGDYEIAYYTYYDPNTMCTIIVHTLSYIDPSPTARYNAKLGIFQRHDSIYEMETINQHAVAYITQQFLREAEAKLKEFEHCRSYEDHQDRLAELIEGRDNPKPEPNREAYGNW